jgi:hypothetical protein
MRKRIGLTFTGFIAIIILLALSFEARAPTESVGPSSRYEETFDLGSGDMIEWEWEAIEEGNLDFWVEDEEKTRYVEALNATSSRGSFEIPESGSWKVVFYNDDFYTIILDYTITIDSAGESDTTLFLILIIILIIIIVLLMVMFNKKKYVEPPKDNP